MATDKVVQTDSTIASYALLDHSVLANHALYDRFYFSTFATDGKITPDAVFEGFMNGTASGWRPSPSNPTCRRAGPSRGAKEELFAGGKPRATAYQTAAEYQMIRGPFNVNSTSVQAWKAVLASMNKSDIYTLWAKSGSLEVVKADRAFRSPRCRCSTAASSGGAVAPNKIDNDIRTNEWNGYRELSEYELEELAERDRRASPRPAGRSSRCPSL